MKKNSWAKDRLESIKRSPYALFFGVVLFLCSSLVTIAGGAEIIREKIYKPIRYKKVLYQRLLDLAPETNIGYFISKLGNPAFINTFEKTKEYIFAHEYFFVQAITDLDEKVLGYSVTTLDSSFNPKVVFFDLYLGKSTFSDLKDEFGGLGEPDWLISVVGAHDFFYTEGYYIGNPGGYQSFFFSSTQAGYIGSQEEFEVPFFEYYESPNLDMDFSSITENKLPDNIKKAWLENNNIINTYTVLGPFVSINDIKEIRDDHKYYLFGPDHNQVRLLYYPSLPSWFGSDNKNY